MRPEIVSSGAGEALRGGVPRFLRVAFRAWRGITLRQWAWTTAIALLLVLAYMLTVLPAVSGRLWSSNPSPSRLTWGIMHVVGAIAAFLAAGYCLLLAVSIAEAGAAHRPLPARRYFAAGLAACGAAILIELALHALVPSTGWIPALTSEQLPGHILYAATNLGLTFGLALAVYVRFRSARFAREAFNAAELERVGASREVLASRLAAMQARVEPRLLLGTLAQVEALYDRDLQAGDRLLDALVAYLHAALPQLRGQRSTLGAEVQLAESYLRIVQIRMGSRLDFKVDVRPELGDCDFPPMLLLPLIDDALRNGLEPLPHGGTIAITADLVGGRVRVRVSDDGLPRIAASEEGFAITSLHERLKGLYGTAARLALTANAPQGVIADIEVPA